MVGETGEFMSRIGGRPFIMKEDEETKEDGWSLVKQGIRFD